MGESDPGEEVRKLQVPEPKFKSHPGAKPARLTDICETNFFEI